MFETEAGSLSDGLGREELIEDAVANVRWNAWSVVDDPHDDELSARVAR